ncbi:hypothetical protein AMAG_01339 [Allomyces macrogynus ATCC 38327]|uniref:Uncharacterized protein n=1 Tax=Allomyces macrogynus (strain ATCC 38327) TaxID=578462 RepID=A0A0L0RYL0_ALLM3|nr:hypothetical protein AMAG_01339 [Allomyces macrogynus ATCC 38327]|eukprot:KNE55448.1 hypothetical protein AMAG_01339 [Allomyces macrogynus ATCC 38327]
MSTAAGVPSPVTAQQRPHARPRSTVDDAALFGPLVATAAHAAIAQVHHDAAMNRASRVLSMMSELPVQQQVQQQHQQRRTSRPPPPPPRRIGMARTPSLASMSDVDVDEDEPWTEVAPSTTVSALPPPPPAPAAGLRAARGSTAVAARGMGTGAPEFDPYDVAPPVWAGRTDRFAAADDDASDTALYEPVTVVDDDVHDDGGRYVSPVAPAPAAAAVMGGNTPAAHGAVFDDIYQAYLDDRTVIHDRAHAADAHSMAAQPEETDTGADADDAAEWREDLRYRAFLARMADWDHATGTGAPRGARPVSCPPLGDWAHLRAVAGASSTVVAPTAAAPRNPGPDSRALLEAVAHAGNHRRSMRALPASRTPIMATRHMSMMPDAAPPAWTAPREPARQLPAWVQFVRDERTRWKPPRPDQWSAHCMDDVDYLVLAAEGRGSASGTGPGAAALAAVSAPTSTSASTSAGSSAGSPIAPRAVALRQSMFSGTSSSHSSSRASRLAPIDVHTGQPVDAPLISPLLDEVPPDVVPPMLAGTPDIAAAHRASFLSRTNTASTRHSAGASRRSSGFHAPILPDDSVSRIGAAWSGAAGDDDDDDDEDMPVPRIPSMFAHAAAMAAYPSPPSPAAHHGKRASWMSAPAAAARRSMSASTNSAPLARARPVSATVPELDLVSIPPNPFADPHWTEEDHVVADPSAVSVEWDDHPSPSEHAFRRARAPHALRLADPNTLARLNGASVPAAPASAVTDDWVPPPPPLPTPATPYASTSRFMSRPPAPVAASTLASTTIVADEASTVVTTPAAVRRASYATAPSMATTTVSDPISAAAPNGGGGSGAPDLHAFGTLLDRVQSQLSDLRIADAQLTSRLNTLRRQSRIMAPPSVGTPGTSHAGDSVISAGTSVGTATELMPPTVL